jgi:phosphatidate cytidylyltransferase
VLRFPLGSSSDPRDIERPAVQQPDPISEPVDLPHWTEPATGQVPAVLRDGDEEEVDDFDDWASFATSTPRWRDDASGFDDDASGFEDVAAWGEQEDDQPLGALDDSERLSHDDYFTFADLDEPAAEERGWEDDDTGFVEAPPRRRAAATETGRRATAQRTPRTTGGGGGAAGGERDMGLAVIVGVAFLAVALFLFNMGPTAAMALVTVIIGVAAAELFAALKAAGYEPLPLVGIVGSVGLVLGAYNNGSSAIPPILFLCLAVTFLHYLVGAASDTPTMNSGVTMLGIVWVGMCGSFAGLMLGIGEPGIGVLLAAILGTIAYDVGGLFIGKNAGRQPLSAASPNKTVEGLIGGMAAVLIVIVAISAGPGFGPINSAFEGVLVALVIAVAAPVGDLCESVIKRDLGVKDMGTLLPGHGGLMDRFDALLFVLPAVYMLFTVKDFF